MKTKNKYIAMYFIAEAALLASFVNFTGSVYISLLLKIILAACSLSCIVAIVAMRRQSLLSGDIRAPKRKLRQMKIRMLILSGASIFGLIVFVGCCSLNSASTGSLLQAVRIFWFAYEVSLCASFVLVVFYKVTNPMFEGESKRFHFL